MTYPGSGAFLFAFISLGCFSFTSQAAPSGDVGTAIYDAEASAVVLIRVSGTSKDGNVVTEAGSGFVISRSGYVLTASHVIPDGLDPKTLVIGGSMGPNTEGASAYALKILRRSDTVDAVLLKFVNPPPGLSSVRLRKAEARNGEQLFVMGYPLAYPNTYFLEGRVGTHDNQTITTAVLVDRGNSGGPLLDARGCAIGLVTSGVTSIADEPVNGIKFAVPLTAIREMLPGEVWNQSISSAAGKATDTIHVTDTLSRVQTDHGFGDTVRSYTDQIPSRNGYRIERIEGIGHESLAPTSLQYPDPAVSADGSVMTFKYTLSSGPIWTNTRSWIDMSINTLQRRIESSGPSTILSDPCD